MLWAHSKPRDPRLVGDALLAKRKTWRFLAWPLVVGVVIIGAQGIVGALNTWPAGSYAGQWFELLTGAVSILLLFLRLHFWERRPFSTVGFCHGHGAPRFFAGLLGGFPAIAGATFVLVAMGKYEIGASEHTTTGAAAPLPVLAVLVVWLVQGSILGIPVSGNPYAVSLLALGPAKDAPTWLTGGDFGIEASAVATVVLAALSIWSCFYVRKATARRLAGVEATAPREAALEAPARA